MTNQLKASTYHRNYINEINKQMEVILEQTIKEIMPHVRLLPAVIEKHSIIGFYDIESEEGSSDKIRVRKLTTQNSKQLTDVFNIDFSGWDGFGVEDSFYRYGESYLVALNPSKTVILSTKEYNAGNRMGLIIEDDTITYNTLEDSEGLLWLLCTLIDVFFNLEPAYN